MPPRFSPTQDLDGNKCVEVVKTAILPGHTHQPIRIGHTCVGLKEVWSGGVVRYLIHRHLRYLYQPSVGKFVLLRGLDDGHTSSALHGMRGGLSLEQHSKRYECTILWWETSGGERCSVDL